jgi:flagellar motor switch protein FliN
METQAQSMGEAFHAAWQQVAATKLGDGSSLALEKLTPFKAAELTQAPSFARANGTVFATSCFGDLSGAVFFCLSVAASEALTSATAAAGGPEALLDEVFAGVEIAGAIFTPVNKLEPTPDWPEVVGGETWLASGELTLAGMALPALLLYAPHSAWPDSAIHPPVEQYTMAPPGSVEEQKLKRLERLLDVELDVVVRFGLTQAPLRDIVRYGAGSLVELNRTVDEPVDILVNGRSLAQGEVVVIDGYYGVRITTISTPGERALSLL